MILVDTSVWIEYLRKKDIALTDALKSYLKRNEVYAVSAVFGELLQGVKDERERAIIWSLWLNLPKLNENNMFIMAGALSNQYNFYSKGVGLIDCYILATARENNVPLWTLDKRMGEAIRLLMETE